MDRDDFIVTGIFAGIAMLLVVLFALAPAPGQAQTTRAGVTSVAPLRATSKGGNASGTITTTSTFQKLFGAGGAVGGSGSSRSGCTIQNNATSNKMYISEGLGTAASTLTNSVVLAAGGIYHCGDGVVVLDGEIDITGTTGDAFYAAQY